MPIFTRPARAGAVSLLMFSSMAVSAFAAPGLVAPTAPPPPKDNITVQAAALADTAGTQTKKAWTYMNTERPHTETTLKMRRKALRTFAPVTRAMGGGISYTDSTMSRPFLLLILSFMFVLGLLSISSATSRTGNHH